MSHRNFLLTNSMSYGKITLNNNKHSLVSLSRDLYDNLIAKINDQLTNYVIFQIEKHSTNDLYTIEPISVYMTWDGTFCEGQNTIGIPTAFANIYGYHSGDRIIITRCIPPVPSPSFTIYPDNPNDYEIVELNQDEIINTFLDQICVLTLGSRVPIWVHNTLIHFEARVSPSDPPHRLPFVLLAPNTDLIIVTDSISTAAPRESNLSLLNIPLSLSIYCQPKLSSPSNSQDILYLPLKSTFDMSIGFNSLHGNLEHSTSSPSHSHSPHFNKSAGNPSIPTFGGVVVGNNPSMGMGAEVSVNEVTLSSSVMKAYDLCDGDIVAICLPSEHTLIQQQKHVSADLIRVQAVDSNIPEGGLSSTSTNYGQLPYLPPGSIHNDGDKEMVVSALSLALNGHALVSTVINKQNVIAVCVCRTQKLDQPDNTLKGELSAQKHHLNESSSLTNSRISSEKSDSLTYSNNNDVLFPQIGLPWSIQAMLPKHSPVILVPLKSTIPPTLRPTPNSTSSTTSTSLPTVPQFDTLSSTLSHFTSLSTSAPSPLSSRPRPNNPMVNSGLDTYINSLSVPPHHMSESGNSSNDSICLYTAHTQARNISLRQVLPLDPLLLQHCISSVWRYLYSLEKESDKDSGSGTIICNDNIDGAILKQILSKGEKTRGSNSGVDNKFDEVASVITSLFGDCPNMISSKHVDKGVMNNYSSLHYDETQHPHYTPLSPSTSHSPLPPSPSSHSQVNSNVLLSPWDAGLSTAFKRIPYHWLMASLLMYTEAYHMQDDKNESLLVYNGCILNIPLYAYTDDLLASLNTNAVSNNMSDSETDGVRENMYENLFQNKNYTRISSLQIDPKKYIPLGVNVMIHLSIDNPRHLLQHEHPSELSSLSLHSPLLVNNSRYHLHQQPQRNLKLKYALLTLVKQTDTSSDSVSSYSLCNVGDGLSVDLDVDDAVFMTLNDESSTVININTETSSPTDSTDSTTDPSTLTNKSSGKNTQLRNHRCARVFSSGDVTWDYVRNKNSTLTGKPSLSEMSQVSVDVGGRGCIVVNYVQSIPSNDDTISEKTENNTNINIQDLMSGVGNLSIFSEPSASTTVGNMSYLHCVSTLPQSSHQKHTIIPIALFKYPRPATPYLKLHQISSAPLSPYNIYTDFTYSHISPISRYHINALADPSGQSDSIMNLRDPTVYVPSRPFDVCHLPLLPVKPDVSSLADRVALNITMASRDVFPFPQVGTWLLSGDVHATKSTAQFVCTLVKQSVGPRVISTWLDCASICDLNSKKVSTILTNALATPSLYPRVLVLHNIDSLCGHIDDVQQHKLQHLKAVSIAQFLKNLLQRINSHNNTICEQINLLENVRRDVGLNIKNTLLLVQKNNLLEVKSKFAKKTYYDRAIEELDVSEKERQTEVVCQTLHSLLEEYNRHSHSLSTLRQRLCRTSLLCTASGRVHASLLSTLIQEIPVDGGCGKDEVVCLARGVCDIVNDKGSVVGVVSRLPIVPTKTDGPNITGNYRVAWTSNRLQQLVKLVKGKPPSFVLSVIYSTLQSLFRRMPLAPIGQTVTVDLEDIPELKSHIKTADSQSLDFSDVSGLSYQKSELLSTIQTPFIFSRVFSQSLMKPRSGILLYGPPGCGKTLLAAAVEKECGVHAVYVKGPELLDKYIGGSEEKVRDLFRRAREQSPSIIVIDEVDSILPQRGSDNTGVNDRVVNSFLCELDGVEQQAHVVIVATTSRPDLVDAAILRPGRVDKAVYCGDGDNDQETIVQVDICSGTISGAEVVLAISQRDTDSISNLYQDCLYDMEYFPKNSMKTLNSSHVSESSLSPTSLVHISLLHYNKTMMLLRGLVGKTIDINDGISYQHHPYRSLCADSIYGVVFTLDHSLITNIWKFGLAITHTTLSNADIIAIGRTARMRAYERYEDNQLDSEDEFDDESDKLSDTSDDDDNVMVKINCRDVEFAFGDTRCSVTQTQLDGLDKIYHKFKQSRVKEAFDPNKPQQTMQM